MLSEKTYTINRSNTVVLKKNSNRSDFRFARNILLHEGFQSNDGIVFFTSEINFIDKNFQ